MNRQKEKKRLDKLWKKMRQYFQSFRRTGHAEQLHQFRIQVKKVRSFLTLLEAGKKNHGLLEGFTPVKKIFKSAGVVRDVVVHRKGAEEQGINWQQLYNGEEEAKEAERKKLLRKSRKHLHTMKRVKKKLHRHLHPVSNGDMEVFFQSQIRHTNRLLSRHTFTERLHESRKALKHVLYNQSSAEAAMDKEAGINFAYVDELQEALGNWHDNKLSLEFFSRKLEGDKLHPLTAKSKVLQETVTQKADGFLERIHDIPDASKA